MAITFKTSGSFKRTLSFLHKMTPERLYGRLKYYGEKGVKALSEATPVDTGLTASSWSYKITVDGGRVSINWNNSNTNNGVPIALVIQYGHVSRNGGWIEGRDYINPAMQPIFDEMVNDVWKEVTNS